MSDPRITFFPVGNGDTTLITLSDNTDILIDCNITKDSKDPDEKERYDVHSHLLMVLKKDKREIPHLDAFILSHPDVDHCRGFDDTFFTGNPKKYSEQDKRHGKIIIDELWFAPRIFSPHETAGNLSDEANQFRKEANRRIALYKQKSPERTKAGNRLRIIGYSDNPELEGLIDIITVPGDYINLINGEQKHDFSFFVHAPFRKDSDSSEDERNDTSIVLQAQFDVDGIEGAGLIFLGGDSGCTIWADILERSDEKNLKWDIFMAPHHCSWTFFSEKPYKENKIPSESSLEILNKKHHGALVVCSCKPIKKDDDNPPHYAAKEEYIKIVGDKNLITTMEHPEEKQPLPIEFEISKKGPVKIVSSKVALVTSSSAIQKTTTTPQTYGK